MQFITLTKVTTSGIKGCRNYTITESAFRVRPEAVDAYFSQNVVINGNNFAVRESLAQLDELLGVDIWKNR